MDVVESPEVKPDIEQMVSDAQTRPFNPFDHLVVSEIVALTGRYTKQWRNAHAALITDAQDCFSCTPEEACFFADLKSTAESIIDRETITTVGDSIAALVRGIGSKNPEMSLNLIKAEYSEVKPALQNEIGKRVRDVTHKTYEAAQAAKVLSILYKFLDVREKDWMRS